MTRAKRFARRLLPERLLRPLRGPWHRVEELDPRLLARRWALRRDRRGSVDGELALRPGLRLAIDPRSRRPFEWYGFRSLAGVRELDFFLRLMDGRRRLLDVGASHGLFSLVFTRDRPEARALALEPSPAAWEVLAVNLAANPGCRVRPLRQAAGAARGEVRMRPVWHHLEALAAGEEGAGALTLPVRPLDEICAEEGFEPDLVKIDVEGFELAVLEGAAGLLGRTRPPLLLELHPLRLAQLGHSAAEVVSLFAAHAYRLSTLAGGEVRERDLAAGDATLHLLCRPLEAAP